MPYLNVMNHPKLKIIRFPLLTLTTVYMLTGGDYISSLRLQNRPLLKFSLRTLNISVMVIHLLKQSAMVMGIEGCYIKST